MRSMGHVVHAYRITPWRVHRQQVGNFLLVVVGLAMIAALYLDVTSQAAIAGREIQDLASGLNTGRHAIADLETQLAGITSANAMEERALTLGFVPMEPAETDYVMVPGYRLPQPQILAAAPPPEFRAPSVAPEYTQSLLDWIHQSIGTRPMLGRLP